MEWIVAFFFKWREKQSNFLNPLEIGMRREEEKGNTNKIFLFPMREKESSYHLADVGLMFRLVFASYSVFPGDKIPLSVSLHSFIRDMRLTQMQPCLHLSICVRWVLSAMEVWRNCFFELQRPFFTSVRAEQLPGVESMLVWVTDICMSAPRAGALSSSYRKHVLSDFLPATPCCNSSSWWINPCGILSYHIKHRVIDVFQNYMS